MVYFLHDEHFLKVIVSNNNSVYSKSNIQKSSTEMHGTIFF